MMMIRPLILLALLAVPMHAHAQDALDKMVLAFDGDWSRKQIEREIGAAMKGHGVALTEENYSRAGSALVAMRRETGVSEMAILRCVNSAGYPKGTSYPDIVAICAVMLERR